MKTIHVMTAIEQHRLHRNKPEVLSRLRDPFIHHTKNVKTSSPSGWPPQISRKNWLVKSNVSLCSLLRKPWAKTIVLFSESTPTYKHSLKSYLSKMQCTWVGRHRLNGNDCRSGGKVSFTTGRTLHTCKQRCHIIGGIGGN